MRLRRSSLDRRDGRWHGPHDLPATFTTALAALAVSVLLAACGDTNEPSTPSAATSTPVAASTPAVDLAPLLVADDVLPGFHHTGADPVQQEDVDAWVATNQEPDSSQLKALGFVAGARQDLTGPPGAFALNLVERFRTAEGADERLSSTVRELASQKGRFRVSGVPGAIGFETRSGLAPLRGEAILDP